MMIQKYSSPSFATIISVLSIILYSAGFLRVELELNKQNERINGLENTVAKSNPQPDTQNLMKDVPGVVPGFGYSKSVRSKRHAKNTTTAGTILQINKLFSEGRLQLCQTKGHICSSGPPGPPGPPGAIGQKGARGRRGQKGRAGNKGDRGIMGLPGKSGKQGIIGLPGLKGKAGHKGQKGDIGPAGMPGAKGNPGESISAPFVSVSPAKLTVNETGSASFQCSANGNPEPVAVWSKLDNHSVITHSRTLNLKNVAGRDSGSYQCSASNILAKSRAVAQLVVNARPRISLHPGPLYVIKHSNVTFPTCEVTGHPAPVVTWARSFGQLPHGRVEVGKKGVLKLSDVRKSDSDNYLCSAANLLGTVTERTVLVVVSPPRFTAKPSEKVVAQFGQTLTLNCSATGDPQPVISWRKQGEQLPVGRSTQINGALVIRNITTNDVGYYSCIASSAGVFQVEAFTYVDIQTPKGCSDHRKLGQTLNGVYLVNPDNKESFNVYCDMRTDGGGWTVFQRRQDGSVDFYRGWNDYKSGFGHLTSEFWLGNDKIHRLTASRPSSLRVELEDWDGATAYAKYDRFSIGDEQAQYRLQVGSYSGTAGDSLRPHNNNAFSTKDRDNDRSSNNCAERYTGAWWYYNCYHSSLNGKYIGNNGPTWYHFKHSYQSLKSTEMKLRPSS